MIPVLVVAAALTLASCLHVVTYQAGKGNTRNVQRETATAQEAVIKANGRIGL